MPLSPLHRQVVFGWAGSKWCGIYPATNDCWAGALRTGASDCGSSGNNGVRSYQYNGGS